MAHWLSEVFAEGRALGEADRYEELLALIEPAFEVDDLDPEELEILENNYAWTLLHVGRADDAVALASDLLDRVAALGRSRPDTTNVLGMALVAAGQPREALELLDDQVATAVADDRWILSAHFLFRGDALRALERSLEAAAAWRDAVHADPTGLYGTRAAARLDDLARGTPYRSRG